MKYVTILFMLLSTSVFAQNLGYINSSSLLQKMPDRVEADSILTAYQKDLGLVLDSINVSINKAKEGLNARLNDGSITQSEVNKVRDDIANMEKEGQKAYTAHARQIEQKRVELLNPLVVKINKAVSAVAEAKNLDIVVENADGRIWYAKQSCDIQKDVERALGIL